MVVGVSETAEAAKICNRTLLAIIKRKIWILKQKVKVKTVNASKKYLQLRGVSTVPKESRRTEMR